MNAEVAEKAYLFDIDGFVVSGGFGPFHEK